MNVDYLEEVRGRLLKILWVFLLFFIACFFYKNRLLTLLSYPLHGTGVHKLVSISLLSPVFVPIELSSKVALLLTLPFVFYQAWAFLCPALYEEERALVLKYTFFSSMLFYLSLLFCFFIALPLLMQFFTGYIPGNVILLPDIERFLQLSMRFYLIFAMMFEMPVIMHFLVKLKVLSIEKLFYFRPYFIVCAFIIGMLFTPPDVCSQILLALPLCILYELGILWCKSIEII